MQFEFEASAGVACKTTLLNPAARTKKIFSSNHPYFYTGGYSGVTELVTQSTNAVGISMNRD